MCTPTRSTAPDMGGDRSEDDVESPSRWVKTGTVCAIGLGATLLACTVIIATGHGHPGTSAASRPIPSTPTIALPHGTHATPVIGSSEPAPTPTDAAPGDVDWQQVGLGALPFSPSAGPRRVVAGVPSGFADTPQGAVLAACQILGRLSWAATDTAAMRSVAATMTTPSAQALAALTYGPPTDASLIPQLAGFQILTYSPDVALINLALRFHGSLRAAPASLVWSGGDWRLAGAPGPLGQTSWAALEDLTGYVLFSGQPETSTTSDSGN